MKIKIKCCNNIKILFFLLLTFMKVSLSTSYLPHTVNEAGSLDPEVQFNIAAADSWELIWWWIEPTYLAPSLLKLKRKKKSYKLLMVKFHTKSQSNPYLDTYYDNI